MGGHQNRSYKSKTGGSAMTISLKVNGKSQVVDVDPSTPLLYVLRNEVGLHGPRFGCGLGQCGACTVHIDGRPTFSCILPIAAVGDREVTTLEGLLEDGKPNKLQQALLHAKPNPTDNEIRSYMRPNLCRCGTHTAVMRAIKRAAIA